MRVRTVKRYYCDFCKKAGLQKRAMIKHEAHCTMNPDRGCRMCIFVHGNTPAPMKDLLGILPAYPAFTFEHGPIYQEFVESVKLALPILRYKTDNCPACIMSALRQKRIPVPMLDDFNFTAECKEIFANANHERMFEAPCY